MSVPWGLWSFSDAELQALFDGALEVQRDAYVALELAEDDLERVVRERERRSRNSRNPSLTDEEFSPTVPHVE